jgi:hypothetical protein
LLDEAADPPGPLDAAAPPPVVPPLEDAAPPLPELLVPPVASVLEELDDPGVLGVVVADEDDEPPGTMIVSFSFVTVEDGPGAAPGTTVVVSLRSQAERAKAPIRTNRYPLRFMSTLLSSNVRCEVQHRI